jgi:hypothetical protein
MFESSAECPLTQLLSTKHEIHETNSGDEGARRRPSRCSWEYEIEEDEKDEYGDCNRQFQRSRSSKDFSWEDSNPSSKEGDHQDDPTEQPATQEQNDKEDSRNPEGDACPYCRQENCRTCEPGYMTVIVNMKEFSKTFAGEMRLCTLCRHGLCPGAD